MEIKHIKYVDYDGNTREEDFLFNLTKAETLEMEMSRNGGISKYLQKLVDRQDVKNLSKFFKDFIMKSYGEKSEDGRRFVKSKEISTDFAQTEAYSILFMELTTDPNAASEFVKRVLPKPEVDQDKPALTVTKGE